MVNFSLYAITDRWINPDLKQFAIQAARCGVRALRIREKDLDRVSSFRLANELRAALPKQKLFLSAPEEADEMVGTAAGFAAVVGANGIHLPEHAIGDQWSPNRLKAAMNDLLCGVSVHSVESARKAERWGADFLTFGPVYATPSKEALGFGPQGLKKLSEVVKTVNIPVLAIGGITPARAKECVDQGAWGVAAVRDLLTAPNLKERIAEYKDVLGVL